MSDVEYHADSLSVSSAKVRAVFAAVTADTQIAPAEVVATLVRALAIAVVALGIPDPETVEAIVGTLRHEVAAAAGQSGALTKN